MTTHPYISSFGSVTKIIALLRKNFPAVVNTDTIKKLSLAPNNESYLLNVLQFLGLIEGEKRTDAAQKLFTIHDEDKFKAAFADTIQNAYKDLFDTRGDEAWAMTRSELIGYFRAADQSSEAIGTRQAGVFEALRELAGFSSEKASSQVAKPKAPSVKKGKAAKSKSAPKPASMTAEPPHDNSVSASTSKSDLALTVRIEINLPAGGSQDTYDAIFKSIKTNLLP